MAHGIWRTGTSYVNKRSAFLAHVVGPLKSAAEVRQTGTQRPRHEEPPNLDGTITCSSWSNEKVRRYWRRPTLKPGSED